MVGCYWAMVMAGYSHRADVPNIAHYFRPEPIRHPIPYIVHYFRPEPIGHPIPYIVHYF